MPRIDSVLPLLARNFDWLPFFPPREPLCMLFDTESTRRNVLRHRCHSEHDSRDAHAACKTGLAEIFNDTYYTHRRERTDRCRRSRSSRLSKRDRLHRRQSLAPISIFFRDCESRTSNDNPTRWEKKTFHLSSFFEYTSISQ